MARQRPLFAMASHSRVSEILQGLSGRGSRASLYLEAVGSKQTVLFLEC